MFREVRDTAARNLSRVQTGKRRRGGRGREKELSFAPSLIGFSFDIFIYKTLTKNTKKLIATRAMLDSIRWIRSSKGQLVMIPSYRELALCPWKLEKPDRKNADRTKWRERFLCGHYCVYMLWLIFYYFVSNLLAYITIPKHTYWIKKRNCYKYPCLLTRGYFLLIAVVEHCYSHDVLKHFS